MKLICSVCERSANDRNLACTEINCPIDKHITLGNGQVVGDVKIVQLQQVARTYTLYSGLRQKTPVLLKVAHQDYGAKNQLIDEAKFLSYFALERQKKSNSRFRFLASPKDPYPGIPNLLPAYASSTVRNFPYGQTQIHGQDFVFSVWDKVEGIPLEQYLNAIPEPWVDNVAHTINRLAYVLAIINHQGLIHGRLTPDSIWIYEDKNGVLRPTLMDFGLLRPASELNRNNLIWLHEHTNTAYIAPEIVHPTNADIVDHSPQNPEAIDAYGLGLLLYEMLAGRPKFNSVLRSRSQIVRDIHGQEDNALVREDIAETNRKFLIEIAKSATARKEVERAPNSAKAFIAKIESSIGKIPKEPQQNTTTQRVWRIGLMTGIVVGLYLLANVAINF
jgi:serine/threonine protein kinase